MNMNLTVEDLKTIRVALSRMHLTQQVWGTINNVDAELAKHNLKATYRRLPKRKYQRQEEGEYIFEPITTNN